MSNIPKKLNELSNSKRSNWLAAAEYRMKNKWLSYSSQIARRILAIIEDKEDLNQAKLAELLKVSPQQVSKIVKGRENLTLETIYNLSQALGVELISFPDYKYNIASAPVPLTNNVAGNFNYTEKQKLKSNLYPVPGGLLLDSNVYKTYKVGTK
jgi:transcriptional regulator with XRE-family HTH domain